MSSKAVLLLKNKILKDTIFGNFFKNLYNI